MKILIIIFYLLCSASGLTIMKLGLKSSVIDISKNSFSFNITWLFALGFMVYVISFILWIIIINKYNLSYIYPIATSALFILILLSSSWLLKETIALNQIIGIAFIMIGIIVCYLKFK